MTIVYIAYLYTFVTLGRAYSQELLVSQGGELVTGAHPAPHLPYFGGHTESLCPLCGLLLGLHCILGWTCLERTSFSFHQTLRRWVPRVQFKRFGSSYPARSRGGLWGPVLEQRAQNTDGSMK